MGTSMTLFMLAMHLGNGIGPIGLGSVADWLGLEWAFYAAAVCMAAGVVLFAWMSRSPSAK
jgi:predicted MFS family arabinose efflux permease